MSKKDKDDFRHDPELESLLAAYREVSPTRSEMDAWKQAIHAENEALSHPAGSGASRAGAENRAPTNVLRLIVRTAIQVGVAASIGFVIGAYFIEQRTNQGAAMLFSQTEPATSPSYVSDSEESREVVHLHLDP